MTQSAISKQVAQLEEMLNLSLFYRTPHRISLTPAGKTYYLEVLGILKHIEAATTSLMSNSDNSEVLKIALHPTFCALADTGTGGFGQAYPLLNLDIKEHKTLNELTAEYGVHATQISNWKKQALAVIPTAFNTKQQANEQAQQAIIDELHRQLGQVISERDWLKKSPHSYPEHL